MANYLRHHVQNGLYYLGEANFFEQGTGRRARCWVAAFITCKHDEYKQL